MTHRPKLLTSIIAGFLALAAFGPRASAQIFGTNTGTFVYWLPTYATDQLPVNIGPYGQGYADLSPAQVQGQQASTIVSNVGFYTQAQNYPSASGYTISFNAPNPGAINVSIGGMFSGLSNVQVSGNKYTATFTMNHDGGNPLAGAGQVDLAGASAGNPVTNFEITRPGGVSGGLTPTFQSYLAPYQAVRWMNNNDINNNLRVMTAADLMPSGQNFGAGGNGFGNFGNSYDDIINWSNQQPNLKKVWINIPTNADDSFVKAVADKFAAKLAPGKQVVVEYSNEPWNFAFTHPGQIYQKAQSDPRTIYGDTYSKTGEEYGLLAAHVMQVFQNEFSDKSRVEGFLNSQGANQWFIDKAKEAINRVYGAGSVSKYFYYQGISFYPDDNLTGVSSTDQLVSSLYSDLNRQKGYLQNDMNDAAKDGLHEAIYEWGPNGFLTQSGISLAGLNVFRADPRSKQWVIDEYNAIKSILGSDPNSMAMEFTAVGDGWSTQINPLSPTEQEQQGILALAAANNTGVPVGGGVGTVVPEPASLGMIGIAAGLLLVRRPRRR
jgi:hypothetical protein